MALRAFDGIEILLIDGSNVLHRLAGTADAAAQRTLLPRLRATIPEWVATVFMLDGHADAGTYRRERVRRGFEIRYSGSVSGDEALLDVIDGVAANERHAATLVSDDIALTNRARLLGARTKRLAWLEQLIAAPQARSVSIGAGAAHRPGARNIESDEERPPWQPGRGATRKQGNPRRRRSGPSRRSD